MEMSKGVPLLRTAQSLLTGRTIVSEKTLMKNVLMCYIRVTEGKIENLKKEGKMRISTLVFIYTIHFSYLKVHK